MMEFASLVYCSHRSSGILYGHNTSCFIIVLGFNAIVNGCLEKGIVKSCFLKLDVVGVNYNVSLSKS